VADLLGFDDVSPPATRTSTGVLTGAIDGGSCGRWASSTRCGRGRSEHGVDLAESYAYSDSIYDTPLLNAVGHPNAVNPDPRLQLWAVAGGGPSSSSTCPPASRRS